MNEYLFMNRDTVLGTTEGKTSIDAFKNLKQNNATEIKDETIDWIEINSDNYGKIRNI